MNYPIKFDKMKRIHFILLFLLLGSCTKYDEGPVFSIRSKIRATTGHWRIEKYYINGVDSSQTTLHGSTYNLDLFYENYGSFAYHLYDINKICTTNTIGYYCGGGSYTVDSRKNYISFLSSKVILKFSTYEIKRLKPHDEMILEMSHNGIDNRIELRKIDE